jgi:hypothetical protein
MYDKTKTIVLTAYAKKRQKDREESSRDEEVLNKSEKKSS